ncbi:hypothetical protein PSJ8397_01045 [Pseudooctadecabacter jejudonensis]|uniref:Uncharacterized protein n=1 Tax=Pseudooctadecabacter jejudonensis TaxID=1391910 RepID=A0A1Y5RV60_9RHOB|nr:hypothetical protein PSJ8397_01045 [Pseudooctadecabacter jejudonensis]
MGQKWIIDVIADLRTFADQNGLPMLAHQLEVTSTVAQAELTSMQEGAPFAANENARQPSPPFGDTRTGHGA